MFIVVLLVVYKYMLSKGCNLYSFHRPLSTFVSLLYNCSALLTYEMTSPMRVLYYGLGVAK